MEIPSGFENQGSSEKVCKLKKSLYGLKQSLRTWFSRLTKVLKTYEFMQCQYDHTLLVKFSKEGKREIIIVYVDEIIITGDYSEEISNAKKLLANEFEVKDLGFLKYFLVVEVAHSRKGIYVSQWKYILDLLKETGMIGCKPTDTPMDSANKLGKTKGDSLIDKG